MVTTDKIQLFLTELRKSQEEIMADMDVDFLMEKDPLILLELSVLPRERLRLINHFQIIHYSKEKDQPEDPLPILSELSRLQRDRLRMLLYIIHIDMPEEIVLVKIYLFLLLNLTMKIKKTSLLF